MNEKEKARMVEYNKDSPIVKALEAAHAEWAQPEHCHEVACGCWTVIANNHLAPVLAATPEQGAEPPAPREDVVSDNTNDTMDYWRSRAIGAELKVQSFHEEISKLPAPHKELLKKLETVLEHYYHDECCASLPGNGYRDCDCWQAAVRAIIAEEKATPAEPSVPVKVLRELSEKESHGQLCNLVIFEHVPEAKCDCWKLALDTLINASKEPACELCKRNIPLDSTGKEHRTRAAHGETFVGPCSAAKEK